MINIKSLRLMINIIYYLITVLLSEKVIQLYLFISYFSFHDLINGY